MTTEYERYWPRSYQKVPPQFLGVERSKHLIAKRGVTSAVFSGPSGTGKTAQAWAMLRDFKEKRCSIHLPQIWIVRESHDIDGHRWDYDYMRALCNWPNVLVIDDLGYKAHTERSVPSEWSSMVAYCVSDHRHDWNLRTLWTTNLSSDRIKEVYGAATHSRMTGDMFLDIAGHDRRKHTDE